MSLFPFPESYTNDEKDVGILSCMESFYRDSITINQIFWYESDLNSRFEAGDPSVFDEIYGPQPLAQNKQFSFNRIRRIVNMISGHQRLNRKNIIVIPVENGDQKTADQFSKVISWITQQESLLETNSEAFNGALITGMNLLQVWIDYRNDPVSGNIKIDNCPYNSFLIDPFFKKADLSDCNGIWKRNYLTKREVISLMPDKKELISGLPVGLGGSPDAKFQFMAESYNYGPQNLLAYDEFYYRAYRTQKMLSDTESGEVLEWTGNDEKLKEFLSQYPQIEMIEQEVPTVNLAIVVQGKVLYNDRNPLGIDTYNFIPVWAYYNPHNVNISQRIHGVVTNLRDPQYLYNRRMRLELATLESVANSGFFYKENALVNPKDVFLTGTGRGIAIKDEAQMTDVQKIPTPDLAPGAMQLTQLLAKEVMEVSGVNEELIGSATDDKAGILSMLRQGAGLVTLQILFDQLDRSTKNLGKLLINVIQANFTPGKIQRIIEEEPSQEFYDKAFKKYDAAVEEGLNTTTQRQMQFAQMLHLREVGVPITEEDLLEASTLQNKQKIIDNMTKRQEQQAQQQQQMQQSQMELQKANANLADARAEADRGQAIERISRVEENRSLAVERIAAANKEDELAQLNKIRTLKELEDMDINHLQKLISISTFLKAQESMNKNELEAETEKPTSSELQNTNNMNQNIAQQPQPEQNSMLPPEQSMPGLGR